jgi:hypothetical protein
MTAGRFTSVEDARAYAESVFRGRVGEPVVTSVIPNSRNFLFRMEAGNGCEYVVKVYASTSELIGSCEAVAYDRLKGNSFVRECLGIDHGKAGAPAWAIFEYVPGITLLDSIDRLQADGPLEQRMMREIVHFVRDCTAIGVQGYGGIDTQFRGERASWPDFLDHYLAHLGQSVLKVEDVVVREQMERGMRCLQRFVVRASDFFQARPSMFVPVDLNMANFLIGHDDRLVALDLENFLAADPLLALGEWAGHTFGTSRYDAFMEAWGDLANIERASVRFYALLCNMDVLMYIVNNQVAAVDEARPWGNPNRFVDLIDRHIRWLEGNA